MIPKQFLEEILRWQVEQDDVRILEERASSLARANAALAENDRNPQCYLAAARCAKHCGQLEEALAILRRGVARCAPSPFLYEYFIKRLEKWNKTEEAIAAARDAVRLFPNNTFFQPREALLLPVLYDSNEQIARYRRRFTEGLHKLNEQLRLDTPASRRDAFEATAKHVNFFLPYQGDNDRDLQVAYGGWLHRIVAANFPEWVRRRPMPPVPSDGRLRIGYVSSCFRNTSTMKVFAGWLRITGSEWRFLPTPPADLWMP